ncbi:hypothetical protein HanPSC8_Chr10g0412431 [Helianthus annuus]|nr:hypothetical protein HanPSC8_Chr10g0412431 [Helianthus annuus]
MSLVLVVSFFYYVSCTTNVLPCSRGPPKSLHDWKHKFFYICRGVIPIDSLYRLVDEGVPKLPVAAYADEAWYKTLTRTSAAMLQLDEKALVAAGMSMLWAPTNPRPGPIYGYKNKGNPCWLFCFALLSLYVGPFIVMCFTAYGWINALDPKVSSEMVMRLLPEGERPWLE